MYNDEYLLLARWARMARSRKILHMTEAEVKEFAEKNKLAIYNMGFAGSDKIIGWRLYETFPAPREDFPREVGELYYVVEKV